MPKLTSPNWILSLALALIVFLTQATASAAAGGTATKLRLQGPTLVAAPRSDDESRRAAFYDKLLKDTGFPDLPAAIAKTLASPEAANLEVINRETLEANWHRLQIVNFARDFAVELLTKLTPGLGEAAKARKIAELAARLLAQKRLLIPDAFPDAIRNLRNFDQRVAAKENYLHNAIEKNILRMQEQLVSDSLHTIYGREYVQKTLSARDSQGSQDSQDSAEKKSLLAEIQRLDALAYRYVRALYYDHEMGLGHWVGEALAVGLVHTSRVSKDPEVRKFEALLNARAYAHGEYLSDAVSDTLTFEDTNGQRRQIKVKNADTITELYSIAQMSRLSAAAARPNILNRWKAHKGKLLQDISYAAVTADEIKSEWKAIDGQEPTMLDTLRLTLAEDPSGKIGSSHAGMAVVYRNAESGVAVTRAVDMYAFGPMPYGGARFITTKTIFATPGVMANFGVASLQPEKTLAYLQKLTREKGYQPVFKVSDVYRPNEKGELVKAEGETFEWKPRITAEQQQLFLKVPLKDAANWYNNSLAPSLAAEMIRYITDYGMVFRTYGQDSPNKMSCYCTEGVNVAGFRETGFNLQSHPDQVHVLGQIAKFVYPKLKKQKAFEEVPIAPGFMAWDPKTETDTVHYRVRGMVESWMEQMQAPRTDFDPELTSSIAGLLHRKISYTTVEGGQLIYSPQELINSVEVTVAAGAKKPNTFLDKPRANPMGISSADQPVLHYNPVPPAVVLTPLASSTDLQTRRNLLELLMTTTGAASSSKAAAFIFAEISPRLKDPATLELFQAFTAKMMALKPVNPPRMIPHELKVLPESEFPVALARYISEFTANQVEVQTRQVLSDAAGILYGKDAVARVAHHPKGAADLEIEKRLRELYVLIGEEVQQISLSQMEADARVFGTTLAVGLANQILKSQAPNSLLPLIEDLKPYGLVWQDFFESPLDVNALSASLKSGQYAVLKTRSNPGQLLRDRLSRPANGTEPRITELAQLEYSPYAEVQSDLTRSLDVMFHSQPRFSKTTYSAFEIRSLVRRAVNEYMEPLNHEQIGTTGGAKTSGFLQANPVMPMEPIYARSASPMLQRSCSEMF